MLTNSRSPVIGSFLLVVCLLGSACGEGREQEPKAKEDEKVVTEEMYAVFDTNKGKIVCKLFPKKAPKTVENFVGLAEGTKEFTDPRTGKKQKRPFYNGLIFHRVLPKFMIQGGCPLGNGRGDPGYKFQDEFDKSLRFDKPGKLAMANSGPNTNGSQFFITVAPTMWLNDGHTIFGEVVEGQEIAVKISEVPRDRQDKPKKDVAMKKIDIIRGPYKSEKEG